MSRKCVVWDLDQTIWDGVLVEDKEVSLKPEVVETIKELDKRGILNSIASKNDFEPAWEKLKEFGIAEYFIYPQISWNSKSSAVKQIAESINIAIDSLAFVDDQDFELEEVQSVHKDVLCLKNDKIADMLSMDEFKPKFITVDSANRRKMYQADIIRKEQEETFEGASDEFLKSLDLKMRISKAKEEDLQRVEELTVRTHQLNTTGYTFSYQELKDMLEDPKYEILVAELSDKYGTYGKIGIALLERSEEAFTIKLFLMSCRVMSRGVGNVMMKYIMDCAEEENKKLYAEFIETDRNRIMYMTYRFMGFSEVKRNEKEVLFMWNQDKKTTAASYVDVTIG